MSRHVDVTRAKGSSVWSLGYGNEMENILSTSREQRRNLKVKYFCSDFAFLVLTEAEDNLGALVTFPKLKRTGKERVFG